MSWVEFEAITYYLQAVRMILVALDLCTRVDPGKDSGVDARYLHHYAKLKKKSKQVGASFGGRAAT